MRQSDKETEKEIKDDNQLTELSLWPSCSINTCNIQTHIYVKGQCLWRTLEPALFKVFVEEQLEKMS